MMSKFYYNSPIGCLRISLEGQSVLALEIVSCEDSCVYGERVYCFGVGDGGSCGTLISRNVELDSEDNAELCIVRQLDEYFAGKRKGFNLRLKPSGTAFQRKVWDELVKIPYGETKSYQEIAIAVGKPNAQRAIGSACNKNPILLLIPCHRVIAKSGLLSGYAGGVEVKKKLLNLERTGR